MRINDLYFLSFHIKHKMMVLLKNTFIVASKVSTYSLCLYGEIESIIPNYQKNILLKCSSSIKCDRESLSLWKQYKRSS